MNNNGVDRNGILKDSFYYSPLYLNIHKLKIFSIVYKVF